MKVNYAIEIIHSNIVLIVKSDASRIFRNWVQNRENDVEIMYYVRTHII